MNLELISREMGFTPEEIGRIEGVCAERIEFFESNNRKGVKFRKLLDELELYETSFTEFSGDVVKIGKSRELSEETRSKMRDTLLGFLPWRKGPFEIFGIRIKSEWQSNLKWDRLKSHIAPLHRRHILDIGSSSGYYMFRMLEQNPGFVLGIEPYINFFYQFRALNGLAKHERILTLPFRFEEMAGIKKKFNTVFCMGILYHRKSPIEFLEQIKACMARNGELVLETLILEGHGETCLYPLGRYAKMLNVYFIPTISVLKAWLKKAGFRNISCVDITRTTVEEQSTNEWVTTESLADFLDPKDSTKTIEGYPGPVRAMVIARL